MDYPREFSPQARAKVEAAKLKARQKYVQHRDSDPNLKYNSDHEKNLRQYILFVFLEFAREACKLGAQGTFGADRIRAESEEFLRKFTIEAYYEDGYDRSGRRLSEMTSNWGGGLRAEVAQEYRKSPPWQEYEQILLATAEKIAKGVKRTGKPLTDPAKGRRAQVDGFILRLGNHGHKINRKDIWIAAGYKNPTEFERFQRADPRSNQSAIVAFNRILNMAPDQFLRLLEKHQQK